jgi:hypothetical protein
MAKEKSQLWFGDLDALSVGRIVYEHNSDDMRFHTEGEFRMALDSDGLFVISGVRINEFSIDGTLGDNSDTAVPTEKAVKTYVDLLTNIDDFTIKRESNELKVADRFELNTMLNAFRIAINGSLSQQNMIDGVVDEFEDETGIDTNTGGSTGQAYNSTDDYYSPQTTADLELDYNEYSTDELAQGAWVTSIEGGLSFNTKLLLHANGQNGGKEIIDDGNTGHVVTQNGTASLRSRGKFGGKGTFNGSSAYLTVPDHADWDIVAQTNFTIDLWVKHTDHVGIEEYVTHWEDAYNNWRLFHYHGNGLRFFVNSEV